MKPQDAWQATLGQLQLQMNKAAFDTWLRGTEVLSCENGEDATAAFTINVRNNYAKDWLEQRLLPTITRTLTDIYGQPSEITFQVGNGRGSNDTAVELTEPSETIELSPEERQAELLALLPPLHQALPEEALPSLPNEQQPPEHTPALARRSGQRILKYIKLDQAQTRQLLADLKGAALHCIVCVAAHVGEDGWTSPLSIRNIAEMTGYSRIGSVTDGMRQLLEMGILESDRPWSEESQQGVSPSRTQPYYRYRINALFWRSKGNPPWAGRVDKMSTPCIQNVDTPGERVDKMSTLMNSVAVDSFQQENQQQQPLSYVLTKCTHIPPPVSTKCQHGTSVSTNCTHIPPPVSTKCQHGTSVSTNCTHDDAEVSTKRLHVPGIPAWLVAGRDAQVRWLQEFGVYASDELAGLGLPDAEILGWILFFGDEIRTGGLDVDQAQGLLVNRLRERAPCEVLMRRCAEIPSEKWTDLVLYAMALKTEIDVKLPECLSELWDYWSMPFVQREFGSITGLNLEFVPSHLYVGAHRIVDGGLFDDWIGALDDTVDVTV
jgi:hypothetical protein